MKLNIFDKLIIAVVLLCLAGTAIRAGVSANGARRCIERGYPEHRTTYTLTIYCVKRVQQTDSVVALSALKGR